MSLKAVRYVAGATRMGISLWGGRAVWAGDHGWFLWAPDWLKVAIVTSWNWVTCRIIGHDIYHPSEVDGAKDTTPVCLSCCKRFPRRASRGGGR